MWSSILPGPVSLRVRAAPSRELSSNSTATGLGMGIFFAPSRARLDFTVRMGGGPRTFPGGVTKWQWKRMQQKKAKQLLKARLSRERQLYDMRKRAEIKAAVSELERPWEVVEKAPALFSVPADEQLKVLADRFRKPGGFDMWSDRDGPQVFRTMYGLASVRSFPKGDVNTAKPYGLIKGDSVYQFTPDISNSQGLFQYKNRTDRIETNSRARSSSNVNQAGVGMEINVVSTHLKSLDSSKPFSGNRKDRGNTNAVSSHLMHSESPRSSSGKQKDAGSSRPEAQFTSDISNSKELSQYKNWTHRRKETNSRIRSSSNVNQDGVGMEMNVVSIHPKSADSSKLFSGDRNDRKNNSAVSSHLRRSESPRSFSGEWKDGGSNRSKSSNIKSEVKGNFHGEVPRNIWRRQHHRDGNDFNSEHKKPHAQYK